LPLRILLAEDKLMALTHSIKISSTGKVDFGFNEWLKAQDGKPMGAGLATWSAALYLYAVKCVEQKRHLSLMRYATIRMKRDQSNITAIIQFICKRMIYR